MALIPTVRMKKETAVITVNADKQAEWEKFGYKVLEAKAPSDEGAKSPDADAESPAKSKGKKAEPSDK